MSLLLTTYTLLHLYLTTNTSYAVHMVVDFPLIASDAHEIEVANATKCKNVQKCKSVARATMLYPLSLEV